MANAGCKPRPPSADAPMPCGSDNASFVLEKLTQLLHFWIAISPL